MLAKAPPEGVSAWPAGDGANLQVGRQRAFRRERCAWHEALICPVPAKSAAFALVVAGAPLARPLLAEASCVAYVRIKDDNCRL